MITPRERVEAAILGRMADHIPFTAYYNKFFMSRVERELRNVGMCIVEHRVSVFDIEAPDVKEEIFLTRDESQITLKKRVLHTPAGMLTETYKLLPEHPCIPGHLWPWHSEYLFKGPEDYAAIKFMIRNRRYKQKYDSFKRIQEDAGGDIIFMPDLGFTPLQEIIVNIMGIEQFSIEWHVRRDEVLKLYNTLAEDRRKFYPLVAKSPVLAVYGDSNITPEVMGLERFQNYVIPHHNEFADILHEHGKLLVVHFDANTKILASAIANSKVDVIEAFTPYPNSDMTITEARHIWSDKVLWINFPSAAHLEEPHHIEDITRNILREAIPGDRFLIGITEAVPTDRWQRNFSAISRVIQEEGQLPLS